MIPRHPFLHARWIWTEDSGDPRYGVRRFRGAFDIVRPRAAMCRITSDSRYILYVDGALIGRGPARSDLRHYGYDTYPLDLAPGRHVISVVVVAYKGDAAPIAEVHDRGALLATLVNEDGGVIIATGQEGHWRVQTDTAFRPTPNPIGKVPHYSAGAGEIVDGGAIPHGWEQIDFDDLGWETPVPIREPYLYERTDDWGDPGGRWRLIPRDIPFCREDSPVFFDGFPITVAAGSRYEVILNAGTYANGYLSLQIRGGLGAAIKIVYSEALTRNGVKGIRDNAEGGDVVGLSDTYLPGGGDETYSPLHWRAFRFVKLVVETGQNDLTLLSFHYRMTGYPWNYQAQFAVANGPAELPAIMDVDFRTLERCTHETFMDCPYYEQIQYIGDTRLQALLSYVTTGDTRLGARAVRLFDWSRLPEGLTQSRYPSSIEHIIPPFSLIWILMVEDLRRYSRDDRQTVIDALPGCRGVLEWFARHRTEDGVVGGHLPWWNFVDCVPEWNNAAPPPVHAGQPCATINLQYLAAIQAYVRLQEAAGNAREAEYWRARGEELATAAMRTFWDESRGILREGPDASSIYSQHAQAWALLTGLIPDDKIDTVAAHLQSDESLSKTTYYHRFYVVEALAKIGRLERLWDKWLAPWRAALSMNLVTWPESPEPTRSDCHAWSAWPTYSFITHVLGVKPGSGGFEDYAVTPSYVAGWETVRGRVPLPTGLLDVSVNWSADGRASVECSHIPV